MIKIFPSPILREIAKNIGNFGTPELSTLIDDMFKIMAEKNGAGLAAPQIGVSQRLFVYGFDKNPRYPDEPAVAKDYVINPEIIWHSNEMVSSKEGCLSLPGLWLMVSRPKEVIFRTYDLDGNRHEKKASGFLARIIQHETDHLNGVLFPDVAENAPDILKMKF